MWGEIRRASAKNASTVAGCPTFGASRLDIDADQTLSASDTNYANGKFFKTPVDLYNIYLVPRRYTASGFPTAWYSDDERPYANILTVYFTVQTVTNPSTTPTHRVFRLRVELAPAAPAAFVQGRVEGPRQS